MEAPKKTAYFLNVAVYTGVNATKTITSYTNL